MIQIFVFQTTLPLNGRTDIEKGRELDRYKSRLIRSGYKIVNTTLTKTYSQMLAGRGGDNSFVYATFQYKIDTLPPAAQLKF